MGTMPPVTARLKCVPVRSPIMRPNVVIIPDGNPQLKPVLSDCLIINLHCRCKSASQYLSMMALRSLPLITSRSSSTSCSFDECALLFS